MDNKINETPSVLVNAVKVTENGSQEISEAPDVEKLHITKPFKEGQKNKNEAKQDTHKKLVQADLVPSLQQTGEIEKGRNFYRFMNLYRNKEICQESFVKVHEVTQDLFVMSTEYSLAHCVAEDMNMGSGIAVKFSQQFKRRDELYSQKQKTGGLAVLEDKERYIYYLVTKRQSNGKPTMQTMWRALQKLQSHVQEYKVKKLAIPRIGCGLDKLEWPKVKAMLEYMFEDTDVEITVCNFQQAPLREIKSFVKNERYHITEIDIYTAIIYFGTENGFCCKDINDLDRKFGIVDDYKSAEKQLGDIIHAYKNNYTYSLCGFIVRKTETEPFDFIQFQKCINQFKEKYKDDYYYVAFQAFVDSEDDLLMNKIVNMLRYSLVDNDIYVCVGNTAT